MKLTKTENLTYEGVKTKKTTPKYDENTQPNIYTSSIQKNQQSRPIVKEQVEPTRFAVEETGQQYGGNYRYPPQYMYYPMVDQHYYPAYNVPVY